MSKASFAWITEDCLSQTEGAWRNLQSKCNDFSIFQTYEWVNNWWNHYKKPNDHLLIGILRYDDSIEAIFPFFVRKRLTTMGSLRIAQFLGIEEVGPSSMDILVTAKGRQILAREFSRLTSGWQKHADLLDLAPVRSSANIFKFLEMPTNNRPTAFQSSVEQAPVLATPGSFDLWLSSLGSSTRRDIRRKRAYISSQEQIKVRHFDHADDVARGLQTLSQLNVKRLTQLGKHGGFMLPRFEQFHLKFSRELATHGSAHLFELTLGDKVLSAAIVYSLGKTWYAYQTGMDPEYLDLAPGAVLDSHVLEYIFDKTDATSVDMGLGHQDYKLRFGAIPQKAFRLRLPSNTWRGFILKIALSMRANFFQNKKTKDEPGALLLCN
jgi:CelD/BcsL family acetyltransferase involved in cellulose biosynthesis